MALAALTSIVWAFAFVAVKVWAGQLLRPAAHGGPVPDRRPARPSSSPGPGSRWSLGLIG